MGTEKHLCANALVLYDAGAGFRTAPITGLSWLALLFPCIGSFTGGARGGGFFKSLLPGAYPICANITGSACSAGRAGIRRHGTVLMRCVVLCLPDSNQAEE